MMEIVMGKGTPLGDLRPDLSESALRVVGRAMAAKQTERPVDAGALWAELDRELR
jgi:hypothetical protein